MVDILYDIALLEAIKSQNVNGGISSKKPMNFCSRNTKLTVCNGKKTISITLLTLKNTKMYEEVKKRIQEETTKANSIPAQGTPPTNPEEPMVR